MKKIYTLIFISTFSILVNATTHSVSITNSVFTPNNFTANIGDTVVWTFNGGFVHTTTSISVPAGALAWNSGDMTVIGQIFKYNITIDGTYGYWCTYHGSTFGMAGGFIVNPSGTFDPSTKMGSLFFPNPCMNKITFIYKDADAIMVYDMLGNKMKSIMLNVSETKMEIDMATLPQGVYFFHILKEGEIISTKKIVKS